MRTPLKMLNTAVVTPIPNANAVIARVGTKRDRSIIRKATLTSITMFDTHPPSGRPQGVGNMRSAVTANRIKRVEVFGRIRVFRFGIQSHLRTADFNEGDSFGREPV